MYRKTATKGDPMGVGRQRPLNLMTIAGVIVILMIIVAMVVVNNNNQALEAIPNQRQANTQQQAVLDTQRQQPNANLEQQNMSVQPAPTPAQQQIAPAQALPGTPRAIPTATPTPSATPAPTPAPKTP